MLNRTEVINIDTELSSVRIVYSYDDWTIKLTKQFAQQYDHKTVRMQFVGSFPTEWTWHLYLAKECHLDVIPLIRTEDGLECLLTKYQLAYPGTYVVQLYADKDEDGVNISKHTNEARFTIKHSYDGDAEWPVLPMVFSEAVKKAEEAYDRYPYINPETRTWFIWDVELQQFVDTGMTSGSNDYNDLINKPTIPDRTSQLINDSGYLTEAFIVSSSNPYEGHPENYGKFWIDTSDNSLA